MAQDPIVLTTGRGTDFILEKRSGVRSSKVGQTQTYTVTFNGKLSNNTPFGDVEPQRYTLTLIAPQSIDSVLELRFLHQGWIGPVYSYSSSYFLGQFLRKCLGLPEKDLEKIAVFARTAVMPNSSATITRTFGLVTVTQKVIYNKKRESSSALLTVRSSGQGPTDACLLAL